MAQPRFRSFLSRASVAAVATTVLFSASSAHAEESSGTGKGMVGGGLLGGELVMGIEALAGVQKPLPYVIGGVLGAGAGVAGGYLVESNTDGARAPTLMLAGGIALLIPTTIFVLNATSYHPPPDYQEDAAPAGAVGAPDSPGAVPAGPGAPAPTPAPAAPAAPAPQTRHYKPAIAPAQLAIVPPSLVDLRNGAVRVGVPNVEVRPVFTMAELRQYGMQQREEVRVPVFAASF
jgi:hypothetical protein